MKEVSAGHSSDINVTTCVSKFPNRLHAATIHILRAIESPLDCWGQLPSQKKNTMSCIMISLPDSASIFLTQKANTTQQEPNLKWLRFPFIRMLKNQILSGN